MGHEFILLNPPVKSAYASQSMLASFLNEGLTFSQSERSERIPKIHNAEELEQP